MLMVIIDRELAVDSCKFLVLLKRGFAREGDKRGNFAMVGVGGRNEGFGWGRCVRGKDE